MRGSPPSQGKPLQRKKIERLFGSCWSDMVDNYQVKRRRIITTDPMETQAALAKLAAVKEELGRDIRVFETSTSAASQAQSNAGSESEESDDFYEFTADDYYRVLATKKEDKYLKTRKIREAEEAARRSRITKAVIRVRFPDNCTLEATFHPSETFQSLVDLLVKVLARPEVPFFIYTTPPKKQIKDMSQDFYSAGFIPGAIVYFSYNQQKDDGDAPANSEPYLRGEIMSLKGLNPIIEPVKSVESPVEHVMAASPPVAQEHKPVQKKPVKPKWLRM